MGTLNSFIKFNNLDLEKVIVWFDKIINISWNIIMWWAIKPPVLSFLVYLFSNLKNMRLLFILFFVYCFSFSQTNEAIVNQVVETAKSQNITTKSEAVKALEASGMTENQARQLARQRGVA